MPEEKMPPSDIKDVMVCLGKIEGRMDTIIGQSHRTTLALIGVIAAQIGVKVLGTPILLDIATTLAIVGAVLMTGILLIGWRLYRAKAKLTKTGWSLGAMLFLLTIVQVCVYFRDLGVLTPDIIYAVRILQNGAILVFAWCLFTEKHIYIDRKDETDSNPCK